MSGGGCTKAKDCLRSNTLFYFIFTSSVQTNNLNLQARDVSLKYLLFISTGEWCCNKSRMAFTNSLFWLATLLEGVSRKILKVISKNVLNYYFNQQAAGQALVCGLKYTTNIFLSLFILFFILWAQ